MRQAGRSLPEYRAIREQHAFFEINRSAELTAEVTLQPVRRHGVDAAVMFADIMTPVIAMGVDVELVEGVGPVVREPIRTAAAVEKLRVPDPEESVAPILEAIGIVRRELAARPGGRRLLRRAVHRGRLPRRGQAVAGLRVTKALMYREPAVWHGLLERLADTFAAYARRAGAGRRRRGAALRLVGRRALARRLRGVRRALVGAGARRPPRRGRSLDPLRHRHRDAAPGDVRGRRRRDRPRLAAPARRGVGARGRGQGVQGNLDPARAARAVGARSRRRRATCSRAPAAGRATSSTSATAFFPRPIPRCSAGCASSSMI